MYETISAEKYRRFAAEAYTLRARNTYCFRNCCGNNKLVKLTYVITNLNECNRHRSRNLLHIKILKFEKKINY